MALIDICIMLSGNGAVLFDIDVQLLCDHVQLLSNQIQWLDNSVMLSVTERLMLCNANNTSTRCPAKTPMSNTCK